MRAAVAIWARRETARRWRALVALGVLAGLAGGLALAAVAGSRRTHTAYERFREATGRSDAIVFATLLGVFDADYTPVRNLPEVEDAGEFALAPVAVEDPEMGALPPNDDRLYRTVNRPLLRAGRLPHPGREDEVVINLESADQLGLEVGDRITIASSVDLEESAPLGSGPSVEATIVGIGLSNMELMFFESEPGFMPSAALLANHPEIPRAGNLVVRLRPGTDFAAFRRHVADAMGLPNIAVRDQSEDTKRITNGTDLERTALLLFAAAVVRAGAVLVGQAVARTVYGLAEPARSLRAIGFTRSGLVAGLTVPLLVTAATAAVTAFAVAVGLSPRFPVGLARKLEADPGAHVDWLVLGPGAALVALGSLAGAGMAALRATSPRPGRDPVVTGLSPMRALRRVSPLPAVIGAGLALERGRGDKALPVRPALVSAVAAVVGVVGAFGLLDGIDDALARRERSGQFWDADVLPDEEHPTAEVLETVMGDQQIREVSRIQLTDLEFDGHSVPIYALEPLKGTPSFTLLEGRRPAGAGEVVIGPATARALDRGVGDTVRVGGDEGREADIVGLGLMPQTPHFSFDQGAWMSQEAFETVAPPGDDGAREETVLVSFRSGVSVEAGVEDLRERLGGAQVEPSSLPQDVAFLRNVRGLPKALAVFLLLLGLAALAHVLATAVRRRRHDLAVLR
ncbi:MAG TPA: ABC transporter permease, partial [Acidimicrobiales bacterium]|nr:ABC transporter permease [Acidimicrobiales bacterium]